MATDPLVEPLALALAQPADQGLPLVPDHVPYRAQAEPREALLELGSDERQVGEREPQHEVRLLARRDHVHATGG